METIFSDKLEVFDHLSRNDAQAFVDVIDEVSVRFLLLSKDASVKSSVPAG